MTTVAQSTFDSFDAVGANDTSELRKAWRPLDDKNALIVYSNNLQNDLAQLLLGARLPILLCIDDFSYLMNNAMADGITTTMEGAQRATIWYAQLAAIATSGQAFCINSKAYTEEAIDIAKKVMDYFQIKYTEEALSEIRKNINGDSDLNITFQEFIKREFGHAFDPNLYRTSGYTFDGVGVDSIINELATSYAVLADGKPVEKVYWHRLLFRYGDVPDKYLHGSVALVGPARMLFFGPYLHLPLGQWVAEIEFEVAECGADTIAMADAYDDGILNAVSMRFPRQGIYSFTIEFEVTDPLKAIQIRLQMLKGAIEGEFLLHGIEVKRQSLAN
ncbi:MULTISPECIES: hypothetical protein [unclassified Beijerinckia]|uniref:hypothetical protein n=1 Tax=unclassified Beijerinckia TaxID=2638183 RepID=UPI000B889802|nr:MULTISPECIES: hypothetical protein [unclassified Beijerinckia]